MMMASLTHTDNTLKSPDVKSTDIIFIWTSLILVVQINITIKIQQDSVFLSLKPNTFLCPVKLEEIKRELEKKFQPHSLNLWHHNE